MNMLMMEFHGTTFDRPEFNRLIADIQNQKITESKNEFQHFLNLLTIISNNL